MLASLTIDDSLVMQLQVHESVIRKLQADEEAKNTNTRRLMYVGASLTLVATEL